MFSEALTNFRSSSICATELSQMSTIVLWLSLCVSVKSVRRTVSTYMATALVLVLVRIICMFLISLAFLQLLMHGVSQLGPAVFSSCQPSSTPAKCSTFSAWSRGRSRMFCAFSSGVSFAFFGDSIQQHDGGVEGKVLLPGLGFGALCGLAFLELGFFFGQNKFASTGGPRSQPYPLRIP